jgi:hypothetical protein
VFSQPPEPLFLSQLPLELRALLEEQKRRHEEAGNIIAAFLILIILLLLLAFLASLVTGERKEGGVRTELTKGI